MDANTTYGVAGGVAAVAIGICVAIGLSRSKSTQAHGTSAGGSRRTRRARRANGTRRA
jgi:hypothetical protein